ncbi:MAG: aldehyde dehydrogenase family protein [Caulobacterales bacterium]|jgi:acyl-CoA reductase-like NAD-dependent aldehyde dehydrogenase
MQTKVRNPRTGAFDYAFSAPSPQALSATFARLRQAQTAWAWLSIETRAEGLISLRNAIASRGDAIAAALELDTGRRAIARQEVQGVLAALTGWAAQAPHLLSSQWTQGRATAHLTHRPNFVPYPLVGVISPWNFPLTLAMIDTIPALLAGCAVVVKPSEVTPRFVAPLMEAINASGDIATVLAFVVGAGEIGAQMVEGVDAICFTGSVATGRLVASSAAGRMIPGFLELGGKDPLIVLEGANLDYAVTAALRGSVLSAGQACQSIERIYVQRGVFRTFVDRLTEAARQCRLNWPEIGMGEIGPIIFDKQAAVLQGQLDDAVAKGAQVLSGGSIETHGGGLWMRPTVLVDVDHTMKVMTEETFGPIMPIMAFDTQAEAIHLANDSVYGLSAGVFAQTLAEAEGVAVHLKAGAVSLNDAALTALFYEAEKHSFGLSGLGGSRMGAAGFHRFLRRQALIANSAAPVPLSAFAEDRAAT